MGLPSLPVPAYWLAFAACAGYAASLWLIDIYTPPEIRHWRRLARLRGLEGTRGLGDRVSERIPLLRRLREEIDIGMLLVVAGSRQSSESWLVGTAAYVLATAAAVSALDGVGLAVMGELPLPLWTVVVAMSVVAVLRYASLRRSAANRQSQVGEQLADSLLGLAILVPGIPVEDALGLLARCQKDARLAAVLEDGEIERLLGPDVRFQSTRERYAAIGRTLRIPLFQELSLVLRGIDTEGLSPREEYPALSRISAENRLAQNRLRAARAKTGAAAAIALLLIPLLIMVGGGIAFAFLGSVAG